MFRHLKAEKDLAEELSRDVISEKQNINAKKAKTAKNRRSSSKSSTLSSDTLSSSSSDKKEKSKRKKHKRKDHHRKKSHKKEKREGSKKRSRINLSPDSDEKVIEKKHKKNKKEEKATSGGAGEEEDEWVELTKELRNEEAQKVRQEEAQIIGPQIPEHLLQKSDSTPQEVHLNAEYVLLVLKRLAEFKLI